MKPLHLAIVAVFFYSILNVMIDRYLSNISPIAMIAVYHLVVLAIALPLVLFRSRLGLEMKMPGKKEYVILAVYALVLIAADFCYFSAYNKGGSLATLTTIVILVPAFAVLIKFFLGGGFPSKIQLLGWAFAAVGVILVSRQ